MYGTTKWKGIKIFKRNISANEIQFQYMDTNVTKNGIIKAPFKLTFTIFKDNDTLILNGKDTCYKTGCKIYKINEKNYYIKKYMYDDKAVIDEESEFLINDSTGILQVYSLVWGNYVTFIKDTLSQILNDNLLSDTTIFVRTKKNSHEYNINLRDI